MVKIFLLTSFKQEHRFLMKCMAQFRDKYFEVAVLLGVCQKQDGNTILEIQFLCSVTF